jgi:hypothetical protein
LDNVDDESAVVEDCLVMGLGTGLGFSFVLVSEGADLETVLRDKVAD